MLTMWRTQVFAGAELVLDHAQPDFTKVLKFTMTALVELVNANAQDYRVTMANREGTVHFFAIGPKTQTADAMKVTMEPGK